MDGLLAMSSQEQMLQGMLWLGALVAVLAIAAGILSVLRRRFRERTFSTAGPEFTLDELRRMRDQGHLTIQEYERLSARLVEKFKSGRPGLDSYRARSADGAGGLDRRLDGGDGD